ncbi:MAG TPA: hypothetical protein VM513_09540, partial [Kofleriaceae bacterium]|nr:hypothetical protein [Kofleriaceae bacterium]
MTVLEAGATAKTVVTSLAMMAAQGTLLALVALLVVRGGRLRPSWHAAIWLVVLAKFVLPWGPAMPWSLADLLASLRGTEPGGTLVIVPVAGPPRVVAASSGPAIAWIVLASAWALGSAYVLGRALVAQRTA